MTEAIVVEELRRSFGGTVALDGLSFTVEPGSVMGLLGPNGAGKTTTVRILATLLRPDAGRALVCGHDVAAAPRRVRPLIGLTGQYAAVDEMLTGAENLMLIGRLARLSKARARRRTAELIEALDLGAVAHRRVKACSGGQRRRLDLAASLVNEPKVLFLDEPTTGLDVRARLDLWAAVRDLAAAGTSVLLSTQYLEEADRLSDTITVIDHGRVIVAGPPEVLKAKVGGDRVEFRVADPADLGAAATAVRGFAEDEPAVHAETGAVAVPLPGGGVSALPAMVHALHQAGVGVADLTVRRPTLDDVFLSMTGAGREGRAA